MKYNAYWNKMQLTYPVRKSSAIFKQAELMRIGNGYFSKRRGNLTMASHCSPTLVDLNPIL